MTKFVLPIMRARYESDTTLRGRAFFGRAVGGRLTEGEYAGLLGQLCHYVRVVAPELSENAVELVRADLGVAPTADPCPTLRLAARLFASREIRELSQCAGLAVLGTSWASDAAEASEGRLRTSFLSHLHDAGSVAMQRLESGLASGSVDRQDAYALVEVLRGVVLGVAAYLDTVWNPPVVVVNFSALSVEREAI
jgi:hypothetical protein